VGQWVITCLLLLGYDGCYVLTASALHVLTWCSQPLLKLPCHFALLPFQVKGFSPDVDEFRAYVDGIKAGGGGDEPEDVLGGLRAASELPWANDGSWWVLLSTRPACGCW
jgi:hypothetical protein